MNYNIEYIYEANSNQAFTKLQLQLQTTTKIQNEITKLSKPKLNFAKHGPQMECALMAHSISEPCLAKYHLRMQIV